MNKKIIILIIAILIIGVISFIVVKNITPSSTTSTTTTSTTNNDKKTSKSLKIDDVLNIFKEKGMEVNLEESKPLYQMIGAKDGVMFYLDNSPVKLYEYNSEKSYKEALEQYGIIENMPKKGLVILDTNSNQAIEIFNSIN